MILQIDERWTLSYGVYFCPHCKQEFLGGGPALHTRECAHRSYDTCLYIIGPNCREYPAEKARLAALARLNWRPVAAGLPTEADADKFGDVEWSDGKSIWQGHFGNTYTERGGNHWRPIHLPKL